MGKAWQFDTLEKLREAGYEYVERGQCLAPTCKVSIHWFLTPNKKWMPMELVPNTTAQQEATERSTNPEYLYLPHFATCPESRKFSRRGESGKTTVEERATTTKETTTT